MSSATPHRNRDADAIHVERSGAGERVGLVHGFTQTGRSWSHLAPMLAATREVITVDLPYHGQSANFFATDLPDAARAVRDAVGRASYVGYSLGARVCLSLGLHYPDSVERLVLVGASPGIADPTERTARRHGDEALADALDPPPGSTTAALRIDEFLKTWLGQEMFGDLSETARDQRSREENTTTGLAMALRHLGVGAQEPLQGRLGDLAVPTLLVAGADDEKFVALSKDMARRIGSMATVAIVPGARHAVPFSQPERFVEVLESFFSATQPRA